MSPTPRRSVLVVIAALAIGVGAPTAVALDDPPPAPPLLAPPSPTPTPTPTPSPSPTARRGSDLNPAKLPDLGLARIGDLRLVRSPSKRLQLRFSSTLVNKGPGTLALRATRQKKTWTIAQRVYTNDHRRPYRNLPLGTRFAGDGHLHWHLKDIIRYSVFALKDLDQAGGTENIRRARKVGFCIYDNERRKPRKGTPSRAAYVRGGCGTRDSKQLRMGLSVGWGDKYFWTLPGQYVDLTGLRAGNYRLLGVANPEGALFERRTTDNLVFADFRLRRGGKASIQILRQGVRPPGTSPDTTAMEAAAAVDSLPASAVQETTDDETYGHPMGGHGSRATLRSSAEGRRDVDYATWPSTPAPLTQSSRTRSRKGRFPASPW
jgi:hypothetical protein